MLTSVGAHGGNTHALHRWVEAHKHDRRWVLVAFGSHMPPSVKEADTTTDALQPHPRPFVRLGAARAARPSVVIARTARRQELADDLQATPQPAGLAFAANMCALFRNSAVHDVHGRAAIALLRRRPRCRSPHARAQQEQPPAARRGWRLIDIPVPHAPRQRHDERSLKRRRGAHPPVLAGARRSRPRTHLRRHRSLSPSHSPRTSASPAATGLRLPSTHAPLSTEGAGCGPLQARPACAVWPVRWGCALGVRGGVACVLMGCSGYPAPAARRHTPRAAPSAAPPSQAGAARAAAGRGP